MKDPEWCEAIDLMTESAMLKKLGSLEGVDLNPESYEEIKSLAEEVSGDL